MFKFPSGKKEAKPPPENWTIETGSPVRKDRAFFVGGFVVSLTAVGFHRHSDKGRKCKSFLPFVVSCFGLGSFEDIISLFSGGYSA